MTDKPTECEGAKDLAKCLRSYVAPASYFASAYMTLLSVVVGGILARVLVEFGMTFSLRGSWGDIDWNWLYYAAVLVYVVGLWHKYVTHHQFVGWQFSMLDTSIVVLFGVTQAVMLSALKGLDPGSAGASRPDEAMVLGSIVFGCVIGVVAYARALARHVSPSAKVLFDKHYRCPGEPRCSAGERAYTAMREYERSALVGTAVLLLIQGAGIGLGALLGWWKAAAVWSVMTSAWHFWRFDIRTFRSRGALRDCFGVLKWCELRAETGLGRWFS